MQDKIRICCITNSSPISDYDIRAGLEETHYLVRLLRQRGFIVDLCNPVEALRLSKSRTYKIYLLRNLWPMSKFSSSLQRLALSVQKRNAVFYNPPDPHYSYRANKSMLPDLIRQGLPVIPTISTLRNLGDLGWHSSYVVKPEDGHSSIGVRVVSRDDLSRESLTGSVIQPFIRFQRELSFFFIDDQFTYAVASQECSQSIKVQNGPIKSQLKEHVKKRWELTFWNAKLEEINWAKKFVVALNLPYGLIRIDAALMDDGSMLLMEIERNCPFLSLGLVNLQPGVFQKFIRTLRWSLIRSTKVASAKSIKPPLKSLT